MAPGLLHEREAVKRRRGGASVRFRESKSHTHAHAGGLTDGESHSGAFCKLPVYIITRLFNTACCGHCQITTGFVMQIYCDYWVSV